MSEIVHDRENDPELESFLQENSIKFHGHCLLALKLMYSGIRLSDAKAVTDYGFSGRRLRELHHAFPNLVKKAWVFDYVKKENKKGEIVFVPKRKYVEYFIERPLTPTKKQAVKWAEEYLDKQLEQRKLF